MQVCIIFAIFRPSFFLKSHILLIMNARSYSSTQLTILVILRVIIGWHFLYEGFVKLLNPNWTSLGYLIDSDGIFAGLFQNMAANPDVLQVIDFLNIWGLILIGAGLILGVFTRTSCIAGMVLLGFYYLSHPPLIHSSYMVPSEGSYLLVNKNLIEFVAIWVLYLFPTGRIIGIDRLLFRKKESESYIAQKR